MDVYVFSKPGFKAYQSERLKGAGTRRAILVDADINSNRKIAHLHRQDDASLFPIYLEVLANIDRDSEKWEVSKACFESGIRSMLGKNNRFDVAKRVKWLAENGLFDVLLSETSDQLEPTEEQLAPTEEQLAPTEGQLILTEGQQNLTSTQQPPLGPAETQAQREPLQAKLSQAKLSYSVPNGTGVPPAGVEVQSQHDDAGFDLWRDGLELLTRANVPEKDARKYIGMCRKTHGDDAVLEAFQAVLLANPSEPLAFLKGCLKHAGEKKPASVRRLRPDLDEERYQAQFRRPGV